MLQPEVLAHLDAMDMGGVDLTDVDARRTALTREIDRMFNLFGLPGPHVDDVRDHEVAVEGASIVVRSYHPDGNGPFPAHVVIHGGGWTTGSIDELVADHTARHRTVHAECVTVLVEYRLAPEHPFPTPLNDVVAAVRWVIDHAEELGVDPDVVTLGGSSAGANLAAAAILADPALAVRALVLDVPALDLREGRNAKPTDLGAQYDGLMSEASDMIDHALREYLPDPAHASSPLASPVLAPDPSVFPETFIFTAELDVLRPPAEEFARRLARAGVRVSITCYAGALHGSAILTGTWATARRWHDDTLAILRDIHARATVSP